MQVKPQNTVGVVLHVILYTPKVFFTESPECFRDGNYTVLKLNLGGCLLLERRRWYLHSIYMVPWLVNNILGY